MNKPFTKVAAILFAFGALVHLLRLITHFSVQVAGYLMPLWVNVIGVVLATTFAVMLWKESGGSSK